MKKTIKIIDLLNMIANGEELPKKINYDGLIYIFDIAENNYISEKADYYDGDYITHKYLTESFEFDILNDEVEIISDEEEFEDIYNFCWNKNYLFSNRQTGMTKEDRILLDSNFKDIHDTINQLIKKQKKIIDTISELKGKSE